MTYELTEQHRASDGCFYVRPMVAHWASGATAGSSDSIPLCGNNTSWTLMIERPAGAPGLDQDLATAAARERELKLAQIEEEIRRLESQAYAASSWNQAGYARGCAIAGGCSRSALDSAWTASDGYSSHVPEPYQSPSMAPDGSFVGGRAVRAPDGTYVGGSPTICPDGTYVGGSRCVMAPDGTFLGQD